MPTVFCAINKIQTADVVSLAMSTSKLENNSRHPRRFLALSSGLTMKLESPLNVSLVPRQFLSDVVVVCQASYITCMSLVETREKPRLLRPQTL